MSPFVLRRTAVFTSVACLAVSCLHRGLVNGKTQTNLGWGWRPGREEPVVWQHDLFHGDGRPYRPQELELFRQSLRAAQDGERDP